MERRLRAVSREGCRIVDCIPGRRQYSFRRNKKRLSSRGRFRDTNEGVIKSRRGEVDSREEGERRSPLSTRVTTKGGETREGARVAAQVRSRFTSSPSVEYLIGTTVGENVGYLLRFASGQLVTSDDLPFMIALGVEDSS